MAGPNDRGSSFSPAQQSFDRGRTGSERWPDDLQQRGAAGTMKEKAQELGSAASNLASQAKDKAQEWTSQATSAAQEAWETTRDRAQHLASQVGESAEDALSGVTDFIRRYPIACLCVAFSAGFLMAGALRGTMLFQREGQAR